MTLYIAVDDLAAYRKRIVAAGEKIEVEEQVVHIMLIYDHGQALGKLSATEQHQVMASYLRFTQEIQSSGHHRGRG
jgi:hypothetical protein